MQLQNNDAQFFCDSANDFQSNTVGIAYVDTMCGSLSVTVVQDRHNSVAATGTTLAHEIGHLFNMMHDTGELCGASQNFLLI